MCAGNIYRDVWIKLYIKKILLMLVIDITIISKENVITFQLHIF